MYLSIGLRFNYVCVKQKVRLWAFDRARGQMLIPVMSGGLRASYLQATYTYELMDYNNNKGMPWPSGPLSKDDNPLSWPQTKD